MRPHSGDGIILDRARGLDSVVNVRWYFPGADGIFFLAELLWSGHGRLMVYVTIHQTLRGSRRFFLRLITIKNFCFLVISRF
jgi:hypothetical protein